MKRLNLSILTSFMLLAAALTPGLSGCSSSGKASDASGTFEATEVIVSAEETGRILSLDLAEGQTVRAGEKLGHIDDVQLVLKKRQLLANIKGVESKRPDIGVQIAATRQQIATAQTEKQRILNLLKADAANRKQLDDVNSQIATLEKQLTAQKESLENSSRGITDESSALEIQIAQLDDHIAKSDIASPIDGTVLVKYAEAGELAVGGKALFKVADLAHMHLRAYITSSQLSEVKLGQKVTVITEFGDKGNREYTGEVIWISDKSEFTPKTILTRDERANLVYAVKIAVPNDGYLKIGMYGSVRFGK